MLTRYLEKHYKSAGAPEQQAFKELLNKQDPDLYALLLGRKCSDDPVTRTLIKTITTHQ